MSPHFNSSRLARPDVLILDFDIAYVVPTQRAFTRVGASTAILLAEDATIAEVRAIRPRCVVLAASSLGTQFGVFDDEIVFSGFPTLGICNGAQIIGRALGGSIIPTATRESGRVRYCRMAGTAGALERHLPGTFDVVMEHDYVVENLPPAVNVLGLTEQSHVASFETWAPAPIFGYQFHPESVETQYGSRLLSRFLWLARLYALGGTFRAVKRRVGVGR